MVNALILINNSLLQVSTKFPWAWEADHKELHKSYDFNRMFFNWFIVSVHLQQKVPAGQICVLLGNGYFTKQSIQQAIHFGLVTLNLKYLLRGVSLHLQFPESLQLASYMAGPFFYCF